MTAAPFAPVDIGSSAFKRDAHAIYARWRDTMPVVGVRLRGPARGADRALLVTRYADVSALLKDSRFVKDAAHAGLAMRAPPAMFRPLTRNMLALDDPDHARLKRLVQLAFTSRRVAMLEERTAGISRTLIDRLRLRRSFDLIRDYAFPLPVAVISDLLGVPAPDRQRFARWSTALIRAGSSLPAMAMAMPAIFAFLRYLRGLIEAKRDSPADDLVSALVQAQDDGDHLDADELMAMVAILLSAGHETTTNLIGNGMLTLFDHPQAAAQLRDDGALLDSGVEELLRFAGPVETTTTRYAGEDLQIDGVAVPRGTLVLGVVASANRDGRHFANADRLDLARAPNRHLTFGEGGHYCVGAALARMEGRIAFRDLLRHMPGLRPAIPRERLAWQPGLVLRGLRGLPVTT